MANFKKAQETGVLSLNQEDMNDPGTMLAFQHYVNKQHDESVKQVQEIKDQFGLDDKFGSAVWYLRTRSRWTQELEDKLIEMYHKNEECPNMNEWPPVKKQKNP